VSNLCNLAVQYRDVRVALNGYERVPCIQPGDAQNALDEFLNGRPEAQVKVAREWENLHHDDHRNVAPASTRTAEKRNVANKGKQEIDVEDEEDEEEAKLKKDAPGTWNGLDVETELKPINDFLETLVTDSDSFERFADGGDDIANQIVKALTNQNFDLDDAKRVARKYLAALNEQRRLKYEAVERAKLLNRKPIIQCAVCGRTGNYWAPCWVAPRQIGWEKVDVGEFHELN
jgi:hypothetical protein